MPTISEASVTMSVTERSVLITSAVALTRFTILVGSSVASSWLSMALMKARWWRMRV